MLIEIPPSAGAKRKPGTYERVLHHTPEPEFRPYWSAIVWCPECGRPLSAGKHAIAPNGQISPSLGHPTSYPACGWHTSPRLLEWHPEQWGTPPTPKPETCAKCGRVSHTIGGWTICGAGLVCETCFYDLYTSVPTQEGQSK